MIYFGPDGQGWDCPATDDQDIVEPPVGAACVMCGEVVDATDRGIIMPGIGVGYDRQAWEALGSTGGTAWIWEADQTAKWVVRVTVYHRVCFLRDIGVPEDVLRRPVRPDRVR